MYTVDDSALSEMKTEMEMADESQKHKWHVYIARYYLRKNEPDNALHHYSVAETLSPQTGWVSLEKGKIELRLKHIENAAKSFEKAVISQPSLRRDVLKEYTKIGKIIKSLWAIEDRKWTNEYLTNNPQQIYMTGYYGKKKTLHTDNIGFQMAKLRQEDRREELKIYVEETRMLEEKYKNKYGNNSEKFAEANKKIREERNKAYSNPRQYREARLTKASKNPDKQHSSSGGNTVFKQGPLPNHLLDVNSGNMLFRSGNGYVDPQTGTYHVNVGGGIVNTETGQFSPTF